MRRILALLLAPLLAFAPLVAAAQSFDFPVAVAASGANSNISHAAPELMGWASGAGTTITYSGTANTKHSSWQTIGTTSNAWSAVCVNVWKGTSTSAKTLIDLSFDGGTTVTWPDLPVQPNTGGGGMVYCAPLKAAAGATIAYKAQTSTTSSTVQIALVGIVAHANDAPNYTKMVRVNAAETSASRAGSINIPLTGTWTSLGTTPQNFGALYFVPGDNSTGCTTAIKSVALQIGIGTGTPTVYGSMGVMCSTSSPILYHSAGQLIETSTTSGATIQANALTATADSDNIRVAVWGLVP